MASPYATSSRPEIHDLVPERAVRLLDVGCNDGGFGRWLMDGRPDREIWGIEPDAAQAVKARRIFSGGAITGFFPEALDEFTGQFDCITFNHVLEHMVDPWTALRVARERLTAAGCVIAVIPNVRYAPVIADLVFRGRWDYADAGILDRTHLRFFTRRSMLQLFDQSGLFVELIKPVNAMGCVSYPRISRILARAAPNLVHVAYAFRTVPAS